MPCRDPRRVLRLCCNAPSSACSSSGRSSAAVGYRSQRSNGARSGVFEGSCAGGWCAGPLNRVPRGTRRDPLRRCWSAGGEGWFLQINEAVRSGRARGGCVDGETEDRGARRRCG